MAKIWSAENETSALLTKVFFPAFLRKYKKRFQTLKFDDPPFLEKKLSQIVEAAPITILEMTSTDS